MLQIMGIEPGADFPIEAYVRAYRVGEEEHQPEYLKQDDLDYYDEVFRNKRKMAGYAAEADPQDGYMYWRDPTHSGYEPPCEGESRD